MLRFLVLVLVIANVLFFAWRQEWFGAGAGAAAAAQGDRDPNRMAYQINPDRIQVLAQPTNGAAAPLASTVSGEARPMGGDGECLQIGPFQGTARAAAEAALIPWVPTGRLTDRKTETPAVWILYMGPFADAAARARKVDELVRLRVPSEEVREVPEVGDGLSLGRYPDRNSAEAAMTDLASRGVRTARVAQLSAPQVSSVYLIDGVGPALRQRLEGLQIPALGNHSFTPCAAR